MRAHFLRIFLILVSLVMINPVLADQKIKTKSNIKNDRVQQPATNADCAGETCASDIVKLDKEASATKDEINTDTKKPQTNSSSDNEGAE